MNLTVLGLEYKTLSQDEPIELDRLVNNYLQKEIKRDGWMCRWHLFGPPTVAVSRSASFAYYRYTQAMVLLRTEWVGEDKPLQESTESDPIISFINS